MLTIYSQQAQTPSQSVCQYMTLAKVESATIATQHPLLFVNVCAGFSWDPLRPQGDPPKHSQTSPTNSSGFN